jgi:hypothetical protein
MGLVIRRERFFQNRQTVKQGSVLIRVVASALRADFEPQARHYSQSGCCLENGAAAGGNFWTALAERSGDSAFGRMTSADALFPKRRRASLAAAVQNIWFSLFKSLVCLHKD